MIVKLIKYGLVLIFTYFVITNIVIYLYSKQNPAPDADTLVVLGAQVVGTPAVPHYSLAQRLDIAFDYLQHNPRTKVIVCGGQGKNESATEASVMAQYLIHKGIDPKRVYQEDKSTRTAQQFVYANRVLPLGKTVVVTNDFHILRSLMLAKRSGFNEISGLSAPLGWENGDKYIALIREPLALANSWLFDHPNND
ncbi:YdcF family protein [uncultured Gilliamella sp.]|uniref:YdcF family protein n=1 Tax=uncultured Gilliamella sp. TaxID=1193505 RepID=UPI0025FAFC5B|nr:YdcF family protein [uncultured Gilliamella sp.]